MILRHCQRAVLTPVISLLCISALAQDAPAEQTKKPITPSNQIYTSHAMTDEQKLQSKKAGMNLKFLDTNISRVMREEIADGNAPGGVVIVVRDQKPVFLEAYGNRALIPSEEATTTNTIYDLASLTKPVATASSIMKLVEQGRIRLNDPIDKFIPAWKNTEEEQADKELLNQLEKAVNRGKLRRDSDGWDPTDDETKELLKKARETFSSLQSGSEVIEDFSFLPHDRESITIRHLLTHTSGLPSYVRYYERYPELSARNKIVADIAQIDLRGAVGGQFIYSDLGYIVLGDIVERVSGMSLNEFSHKEIFEPLGMNDTMFTPPDNLTSRVAPTEWRALPKPADDGTTRVMLRGDVHDGNAWAQDGISGHAGLFSTASDLGRFCAMLLNNGEYQGARIFSPVTVAAITRNFAQLPEGEAQRGLGWDLVSGYNSQKGDLFGSGYGHTGFTGTSIWIVPEENLALIILTNHVHPEDEGTVTPMRAKIANIVAAAITKSYKKSSEDTK